METLVAKMRNERTERVFSTTTEKQGNKYERVFGIVMVDWEVIEKLVVGKVCIVEVKND